MSALSEGQVPFWAVIPAAGIGSRFAAGVAHQSAKQYAEIGGATLLEYAVRPLLAHPALVGLVIALHPDDTRARQCAFASDPRVQFCVGGAERADSVLAALTLVCRQAGSAAWVAVHDAARPCLRTQDLQKLLDVRAEAEAAILAVPVVDTLKRAHDHCIESTVDRKVIWQAQTPQLARAGCLLTALEQSLAAGAVITDEASALENAGIAVRLVEGSRSNFKVTYLDELALAAFYLQQLRQEQA